MKVILDRFEGDYAVVELPDKSTIDVPRKLFPQAKEGNIIDIRIDNDESKDRKEEIDKKVKQLWVD